MIIELSSLIKMVREAQGISQSELAKAVGIKQPSIARFEASDATLSRMTLQKIAEVINLNPEFVFAWRGNPFRQSNPDKPIKVILPESDKGDYTSFIKLLNINRPYGSSIRAVFLRPNAPSLRVTRQQKRLWQKGYTIFAVVLKDYDANVFIFKREQKKGFFHDRGLEKSFRAVLSNWFVIRTEVLSDLLYEGIESWTDIDVGEIYDVIHRSEHMDSTDFLIHLVEMIYSHKSMTFDERSCKRLIREVRKLGPEACAQRIPHILRKLVGVMEESIS